MKMKKHSLRVMSSHKSPHWSTPRDFYETLNQEFNFDDDPCPDNGIFGLDREWGMSVFVNPPYGPEIREWLEKGVLESRAGKTCVFLIPARTDTKWFHELVLPFAEYRFIKGRLRFGDQEYPAPFPSVVVIFRPMPKVAK